MKASGLITIDCDDSIDLDTFSDWIISNYFNISSDSQLYNNKYYLDWFIGVDEDTNSVLVKVNVLNFGEKE